MTTLKHSNICLVTACDSSTFHRTRLLIYNFINENRWFDGCIYIINFENDQILDHSKNIIRTIYDNIEFINILDSEISELKSKIDKRHEYASIMEYAHVFAFKIKSGGTIFVNNNVTIIGDVSDILSNDVMSISTDSPIFPNIGDNLLPHLMFIPPKYIEDYVYNSIYTLIVDSIIDGRHLYLHQFIDDCLIEINKLSNNILVNINIFPNNKYSNFKRYRNAISAIYVHDNLLSDNRYTAFHAYWKHLISSSVKLKSPSNIKVLPNSQSVDIKNNSTYTRKLSMSEISRLKLINTKLDSVHGINVGKLKSVANNSTIANMTNYEALNIYENHSDKTIIDINTNIEHGDGDIVLSVVIPYFRAGYIGWVPFESLIRQENITFKWELIIIEEDFENPFNLDRMLKYKDQLANVGCSRLTYISTKKWLPLSAKWYFLINECASTSEVLAMSSSDIYCSKLRLSKQYDKLTNCDKNWYKLGGNLVYDIGLDSHVKLISMDPSRSDTCSASAKMELMRKLPLACIKLNVDSWRYNTIKQAGINFYYDNTMDLQIDTININGLNNLSLGRSEKVKKVAPPFKKCCDDLSKHIPIDIVDKLSESRQYVREHAESRSISNIKLR